MKIEMKCPYCGETHTIEDEKETADEIFLIAEILSKQNIEFG